MKQKFIILFFGLNILLAHDIYKEIRIDNQNYNNTMYFSSLGIDIDHAIINDQYIQFDVIHENVEEFYQSRLIQDYSYRDFDYGSMGGYYTFDEIVENLDELSNDYPHIFTQKMSIGYTLEGRDIWAIKVSDNPNIDED